MQHSGISGLWVKGQGNSESVFLRGNKGVGIRK